MNARCDGDSYAFTISTSLSIGSQNAGITATARCIATIGCFWQPSRNGWLAPQSSGAWPFNPPYHARRVVKDYKEEEGEVDFWGSNQFTSRSYYEVSVLSNNPSTPRESQLISIISSIADRLHCRARHSTLPHTPRTFGCTPRYGMHFQAHSN